MKKGNKTGARRKIATHKRTAGSVRGRTGTPSTIPAVERDRKRLIAYAPGLAGALESIDREQPDTAIEQVDAFLLGADYAPGSLGEAYKLFRAGRPAEALELANRVEAPPGHPPDAARTFLGLVHSFRGDCMLALGRVEDALNAFRKSCEIDPNSVASWQLAVFALERESRSLACEAMQYLPRAGPEVAVMAHVHNVDLEKLKRLAESG